MTQDATPDPVVHPPAISADLAAELDRYRGRWVAIVGDHVIADAATPIGLMEAAVPDGLHPDADPLILRVGAPAAEPLIIDCRYCDQRHGARFLCDPAARVLDALLAQGQRFDQPVVEFPEPLNGADAFGQDTVLLAQFLVKAAVTDVAGVIRPVLIFTGTDSDGRPLPHWLYPGDAAGIRKAIRLVTDLGEMAIRRAAEAS